jgi:hypothetical protein
VRAGLLIRVAAASGAVTIVSVSAGRGLALLADVPDRECRDGFSQPVIRRKHPVVAMPVLPRRRDEIGEPVEELKRREFDDAIGSRPRGLPPTTPPDPVGGFVPGQHVADAGDPAVQPADPVLADVLREFFRIGDQSIAEFQTYPIKSLESIETALANDDGETELVLDLQLKLTADTDGLHAAFERAHRRVFGTPLE